MIEYLCARAKCRQKARTDDVMFGYHLCQEHFFLLDKKHKALVKNFIQNKSKYVKKVDCINCQEGWNCGKHGKYY